MTIGTCPGTGWGTAQGQHGDTNNNDNNILYLTLFNKYKERMREAKYFFEKIHIQNELMHEEDYLNLSTEEQDRLYKELM